MKKSISILALFTLIFIPSLCAQESRTLSIEDCRRLAIENNKDLKIGKEKIKAATYQKKAATTTYLPSISAAGTYFRNQKETSLLAKEHKDELMNLGENVYDELSLFAKELGQKFPNLPQLPGIILGLGETLQAPLTDFGHSVTDALRTDTRNVYAGAVTITQPIYMGGKIRAYNKITKYAEELAKQAHDTDLQEIILSTDQAYWFVVSLKNKYNLATSYLTLLNKLDQDIQHLIDEGVATKADGLSVRVKVNEAELTLTKIEDGLSLSRMLLCQLCGIEIGTPITLIDEYKESLPVPTIDTTFDMNAIYHNRPEVQSLELATKIYKQKVNLARAEYLPTIALVGNYIVTNPSVFNSFENKFRGMWNIGVAMQIPLWNWGQGIYKTKAARAEARMTEYQLSDVKEKIELQVNQAAFKVNEANKKLIMSLKNMEKAEENLHYANVGFSEGVIPASNVLEAHTAWLAAQSDKIDAQIDVKLTEVYFLKSLGTLHE